MTRPGGLREWRALLGERARALIDAACGLQDLDSLAPADVARLRATGPPELVAPALELARARRRAARRIEDGDRLIADVEGVEQASGTRAARHKALRFARHEPARVVDLCCGIGGDAIELRRSLPRADLVAVDLDPVRALMAGHNASCRSEVADAAAFVVGDAAFHIDPARRIEGSGRRLRQLVEYRPGRPVLERLVATGTAGAVKLGPGVPWAEVPAVDRTEVEILGERSGLVQAVLWCGELAERPGERTATRLDDGAQFSGRPVSPRVAGDAAVGRFVFVPDPALERAGLVGARVSAEAAEIAPGLGLLTADSRLDDVWLRTFEVLEPLLPWRERRLREALRAHGAGLVRVKIRGGIADANAAERALRGDGDAELWVLGFRIGPRAVAVIARELPGVDQVGSR